MKSILSVAEAYSKMSEDAQNLAATNAAQAQKKQEDQPEIPSWVPGNIPSEKKKEFAEAAKKAWESDNTQFDFNGRTYKITEKLHGDQDKLDVNKNGKIDADDLAALRSGEKEANEELVGNQHKLDVNKNGKIDGDDLAALRAGKKPTNEHHFENETETPGQTQYPGSGMKDTNGNGEIDGEDKAEMPDEEENDEGLEESVRLKKSQDMLKVAHGAMSRDEFKKKWAHLKKPKNKLAGPGGLYKNLVKEGEENPTDKLTIDVPAMIRALEKSREDFKSDEDIHNFVQNLLKKKDATIDTNALPKNEALDPKADAGTWISDFVHSKDPKFDGKSKEKRKEMALAAYYQARRDAGLKEEVMTEATAGELGKKAHALSSAANTAKDHKAAANAHYKAAEAFRRHTTANAAKTGKKADDAHDAALKHEELGDKHLEKAMTKKESTQIAENVAGDARAFDLTTAANQASALAHSTPTEAGALMHHDAATKAHQHAADHYRVYANHAGDPELRRAAEIHHKFHTDMAQHHTLKGVSLSMSEQTVNEALKHDESISKKAHDLSATAKKSNTPSDHLEAMKAHNTAQLHHAKLYHSAAQKKDSAAKDLHAKAYHDHKMAADIHHDTAQLAALTRGGVKEGTSADAKGGPEVMDVATKKMKDDADKNVKAEEAPYTNKADGSEEVTPADKPKPNPTPMTKLTGEQAIKSVAEAYVEMTNEASNISSGRAMHSLDGEAEKKDHADYMKKKFGVTTKYHGEDELSYHGPKDAVAKATIRHYHDDKEEAKLNHGHLYEANEMTNEAASSGAALSAAAEKASNATKKHIDGEDYHSAVDDHLTAASLHAKAAQHHDKHGNKEKADHHLHSELLHHAEADGAADMADDEGDDDAGKLKQYVSDYASQKGHLRRSPKSEHPTPAWHPDHPSNR